MVSLYHPAARINQEVPILDLWQEIQPWLVDALQMGTCACCLENITWRWFHPGLQEWHCCKMLQLDHQESIPQDIYILGQLPGKVSFFSMLIDWVLNGLKGDTCYHSGQRPLSLPMLSDPQSNVSLHRTCQRSRRKIVLCQIILNRQDQTCAMGDLCTRQTFERFSCRIHSQSGITGSNTGEIVICCPVSLEQQPWNTLQNSFCEQLSSLGFKLFPSLVVDLMHEFELGVLKSVLKHLVWCNWLSMRPPIAEAGWGL